MRTVKVLNVEVRVTFIVEKVVKYLVVFGIAALHTCK